MSTSSLSREDLHRLYWQEEKSIPEIARLIGVPHHIVYDRMRKYGIRRRSFTESNYRFYEKVKPGFQLKTDLNADETKLKIAGIMLYWAEGAKRTTSIDMANSDPAVIMIFLKFLRDICGIAESRLRVLLYIYENQNIDDIRAYWGNLTGIPVSQFTKPYVSRFRVDRSRQRVLPYGVAHIRYNDKRLLHQIFSWICEEAQALSGAGTKVANWARL